MTAPFNDILILDFETKWCRKTGYSLSVMTTEEYVRDPRFGAWGCGFKWYGRGDAVWIPAFQLKAYLADIDWSTTAVCAHNAMFDVSILSWIYGIKPCFVFDTLSMGRVLRGVEVGNSLGKLAECFGLKAKNRAALASTDGILEGDLPFPIAKELAEYCCDDVVLCEQIFDLLRSGYSGIGDPAVTYSGEFPAKELRLIDMTIKMFTEPVLELDREMLEEALKEEAQKREGLLKRMGLLWFGENYEHTPENFKLIEACLASNDKFCDALRALGVEVPMKKSKVTGKMAPALAKNDAMFQALLAHDNEDVVALCEARVAVKSTQSRTRAQRFLDISKRGALPVPLRYAAALNLRWGGTDAINLQNMKRGSFLRKAIMAPKGYVIVVPDLSQIEPRVLAWLSDYTALLEIFRSGQDAYAAFGARTFNIPNMTKKSHPLLRQSAKSQLLGCGYGLGWASFAGQLLVGFLGAPPLRYDKAAAKGLGVTARDVTEFLDNAFWMERMREIPHTCTDEELLVHCVAAKKIVDSYRGEAEPIAGREGFWKLMDDMIEHSLVGGEVRHYKCLTFSRERIMLPNGLAIRYPDLRGEQVKSVGRKTRFEWTYGERGAKLFGGKATENVVSALARCVMTDAMLRIHKRYPVRMTVHDECPVLVPEQEAEEGQAWIHEQMVKEPPFMPGIPIDSSIGYGRRYGDVK